MPTADTACHPTPRRLTTWRAALWLALGLMASSAIGRAHAADPAAWTQHLMRDLAKIDSQGSARIGVYVQDLDTNVVTSFKADQRWYLASTVKVPVAMAVLRGIERGDYTLDTPLTVRAADYVDGAGTTNSRPVGSAVSIRTALEQMIIYSDNTASDVLIDLVGIAEVNALVESLVPGGFRRITSLADVRYSVYGNLISDAHKLTGQDLIRLNRLRVDADRLQLLASLVNTPVQRFRLPTLDAAYNSYYASGLNSGRLNAYGELLALLAEGKVLNPASTDYLLTLMTRVATGTQRLKAGFPAEVQFAHKTGTQRRRTCDAGLIRMTDSGDPANHTKRVVVVACTQGESSLSQSDLALKQVGHAICRSGLLTQGVVDAPLCHRASGTGRLSSDPER